MQRFKRWCGQACILMVILTSVIFVTIMSTFILYPIDAHIQQLPELENMPLGRLYHNYVQLMAFLHFPWLTQLRMMDFPSSLNGIAHFRDVKQLFILNDLLMLVLVPLAIHIWRKWRRTGQLWQLKLPFQMGFLVPIMVALAASINFDRFFITFHHLFFRNRNWLFDPSTDPIINVLPESFFSHCFILAFVLFEAAMLLGLYRIKHVSDLKK
ncbi:TIGR01906 family membrane protein [Lactobacillus sp. CC-MHH1034]|nr:TIGR01906 family membrane protein [Agrilactobacillus fermenti]